MPEIQKADPVARKRSMLIFSFAALIGTGLVFLFERYRTALEQFFENNVDFLLKYPETIAAVFFLLMVPMSIAMIYLWRTGATIVSSRRFPPPGKPVVRDTLILSGTKAVYRGRIIQVLSLIVLSLCAALPLVFWYLFWSLTHSA